MIFYFKIGSHQFNENAPKPVGSLIKDYLLHFERNYFTGVNRLTPQTELLHTSKNEVMVISFTPLR